MLNLIKSFNRVQRLQSILSNSQLISNNQIRNVGCNQTNFFLLINIFSATKIYFWGAKKSPIK